MHYALAASAGNWHPANWPDLGYELHNLATYRCHLARCARRRNSAGVILLDCLKATKKLLRLG